MSIVIKSEPLGGIVELSSDDEEAVISSLSTINNGILNNRPGRPSTPDTLCSICLDDLTNKCYTNSCWHLFCFECLKRWSFSEPTCPLCKKPFSHIFHSIDGVGEHETYDVPTLLRVPSPRIYIRPMSEMSDDIDRMFRMNLFLDIVRRNERAVTNIQVYNVDDVDQNQNGLSPYVNDLSDDYPRPTLQREIIGQAVRIQVYIDDAWAIPLPDMTGRFRECSSAFYRNNPAQTYRLHAFILRDLVAVRESVRLEGQSMAFPVNTDVTVTNLIMRSLVAYEIRQLHLVNVLRPFLDLRAVHFCHELYNFANSPYDITGYDRNVQYTYPPHDIELTNPYLMDPLLPPIHIIGETIVLDSDNEEVTMLPHVNDIIEVISSDSDVEILGHSFRSIEPLNSVSIDQPSTSTGIRDSLDRPNNRYNLRRRRILSSTVNDPPSYSVYGGINRMRHPSRVRSSRTIVDSSSDDEESTTASRGSQTARKSRNVNDKRKKKMKTNKKKKRKINTNDSRSETRSTNRNRSYSGSSSSSGETDMLRPINNCTVQI